ncbi:MAG: UDP-3-O-(3-hydroxymyristoyl)glucosamine N-acyltransferase [Lewinellaceae bacterium]|nr:UDP-3-O-(3-hydroxymyristoyl)glucosamine N-acyltransferase [Lewinellaceae bacterium]
MIAQQIFEECAQQCGLIALKGNTMAEFKAIAPYQKCKEGDLAFVPDKKALQQVLEQGVSAVVIPKELQQEAEKAAESTAILVSANLGYSHALMKQRYGDHDYSRSGWGRIHPSAIVHESVHIPESTSLGPNVVIEQGAKIGENCSIMAGVVIEHDAVIGNGVRIHPGTIIGWECVIGDNCLILSNTVIGSEGFGYAQDQYFNHHRIPQTGNVVIGNKVTIGANNTIDRGTYGPTTIGNGCIFDNMCHVAHNVSMGENCIIISGFLGGGSSTIGNRVVASGGTMIKDHVNICDDTYLMHRAGVEKDITQAGMYAGGPVLPMKEYVISNAIYRRLGELRQQVRELAKNMTNNLGV